MKDVLLICDDEVAAPSNEEIAADPRYHAYDDEVERRGAKLTGGARLDADLTFVDDRDEWTGTDVVFDVAASPAGTTLRLVHRGLTAAGSECFEACSAGWTFHVATGLPS